jgi:hypothetical protein
MTIYKLEKMGYYNEKVNSAGISFHARITDLDCALFISIKRVLSMEDVDGIRKSVRDTMRKATGNNNYEVIVLAGLDPQDLSLYKMVREKTPVIKKKSLYSRKTKWRGKVDSNNTKKEDDKIVQKDQEEEKVQEEKTSRGDEKSETGWI